MDERQLCRNYIQLIDSMPQPVPWIVIAVGTDILVVDAREEATTMIMEAVAERFGEILATESIPSRRRDAGSLLGCLIRIDSGDVDDMAGEVRAAFWLATEPEQGGDKQPF
ncbi:hypothetical protein [Allorhodopirellula solitaria]|uniref:Uncharacterized protein n=1 Tax=Allorhodopirellula solitaria TaxID=2527987 RepID=A0A5C5YC58_9BACT|nr:hypothetical protein [Allorhodopirellula solitaria]TWT73296.1 hypothetical protein CA85_17640 [Allorhodopirellula solitaria]